MKNTITRISGKARTVIAGAAMLFSLSSHAQLGLIQSASSGLTPGSIGFDAPTGLGQQSPLDSITNQLSLSNFVNINETALMQLLSPENASTDLSKYQTALTGASTLLLNPGQYTPVPLAPPLVYGFVPGFKSVYTEPEKSPRYFLSGGSIFAPSLLLLPPLPILSAPVPTEIQDASPAIPFAEIESTDLVSPQEVLNTVFLAAP